jgi:ankyrin repeat protein
MMAAAQGNLEVIALLLSHGADVAPQNRWGATALSEARKSFRARQAVELLVQAGAKA